MSLIPQKPEKYSIPAFTDITMLIFGAPGTGKTTFCSKCPSTLILATEPGTDFVDSGKIDIKNWATFKQLVNELYLLYESIKQGKESPESWVWHSFVIDIIDNLSQMCRDYVCYKKNLQYPPANDFGKTWSQITQEFKTELRKLMYMGPIRFISHTSCSQVEVESENGLKLEIDRYVPTFSGSKAAQFLDGIVHCQGYTGIDKKGEHLITFKASASHGAKDRTGLLAQYGALPLRWDIVEEGYNRAAKEAGRELRKPRRNF